MLNQKLVRDCLEFLLGKTSTSVQLNLRPGVDDES